MNTLATRLAALGKVAPAALAEARLVLHWAVQPVAAFGFTAVPTRDDYGHTALRWSEQLEALLSQAQPSTGLHAALHPVEFALSLRREDQELERLPLDGVGLDRAYAWVGEALGRAGQPPPDGMTRPGHVGDLPEHPVAQGEPLTAPPIKIRRELTRWLGAADALVHAVADEIPALGPVQCWPHHFDTAALHVLQEGEPNKSVGVGVSPGDGSYAEPYVYVTPWPYPEGELPPLARGHWHTDDWTGAVLTGSALVEVPSPDRASAVMEMIREAHRECVGLLGGQESEP